jgi:hypothetical protein
LVGRNEEGHVPTFLQIEGDCKLQSIERPEALRSAKLHKQKPCSLIMSGQNRRASRQAPLDQICPQTASANVNAHFINLARANFVADTDSISTIDRREITH